MWQRSRSGQLNVVWIAIGMLLLGVFLGLMLTQTGGRWPTFIFFFWAGPWLFRRLTHQPGYEKAKRGDELLADDALSEASPRNEPTRYVLTDDGEVIGIVETPEAPAADGLRHQQHD